MEIRPAHPGDVAIIADFNAAMAKETEGITLDRPTLDAGVRAIFDDPNRGRYFVADAGGQVVGQLMVTYEWSDWRNGNIWWIQSVYVRPEFRRRGVFRALYRHAENVARESGAVALRLYVHEHNSAAQTTYHRLGMILPGYRVMEQPLKSRPWE